MLSESIYPLQMLLPFIALAFEIMTHLLVSRFWIKKGTITSTLIAYFFCLLILIALQLKAQSMQNIPTSDALSLSVVNFILYSSLAFFYFCFVNIGESSVRVRILRELANSPNGMDSAELLSHYSVDHIIQARIERMIGTGEMIIRENRYYYSGKPKMLIIAKTCQKIKLLLLGKKSFEAEKVTHI